MKNREPPAAGLRLGASRIFGDVGARRAVPLHHALKFRMHPIRLQFGQQFGERCLQVPRPAAFACGRRHLRRQGGEAILRGLTKNLLRAVMGRWMARDPEMVWILGEIARLAVAMQVALQAGDVSSFGALLGEHGGGRCRLSLIGLHNNTRPATYDKTLATRDNARACCLWIATNL
jgi:hypothetical protein